MTWLKQNRSLAIVLLVVAIAVGYNYYRDHQPTEKHHKALGSLTAAQQQCAETVMLAHTKLQAILAEQEAGLISKLQPVTEITFAKRRLQEKYCTEFVDCILPDDGKPYSALRRSTAVADCIRDEEKDEIEEDREAAGDDDH